MPRRKTDRREEERGTEGMNVIFTCGGTAGHVNPALALAGFLRERDPKTRI